MLFRSRPEPPSLAAEKVFLDGLFEEQPDDRRRHERENDAEREMAPFRVPPQHPERHFPNPHAVKTQHGEDRSDLDADREGVRGVARVDPEQALCDEQVAGRADRQILGDSLDDPEDEGLEIIHPSEAEPRSDRAFPGFLGADPDGVFDRKDENLAEIGRAHV